MNTKMLKAAKAVIIVLLNIVLSVIIIAIYNKLFEMTEKRATEIFLENQQYFETIKDYLLEFDRFVSTNGEYVYSPSIERPIDNYEVEEAFNKIGRYCEVARKMEGIDYMEFLLKKAKSQQIGDHRIVYSANYEWQRAIEQNNSESYTKITDNWYYNIYGLGHMTKEDELLKNAMKFIPCLILSAILNLVTFLIFFIIWLMKRKEKIRSSKIMKMMPIVLPNIILAVIIITACYNRLPTVSSMEMSGSKAINSFFDNRQYFEIIKDYMLKIDGDSYMREKKLLENPIENPEAEEAFNKLFETNCRFIDKESNDSNDKTIVVFGFKTAPWQYEGFSIIYSTYPEIENHGWGGGILVLCENIIDNWYYNFNGVDVFPEPSDYDFLTEERAKIKKTYFLLYVALVIVLNPLTFLTVWFLKRRKKR